MKKSSLVLCAALLGCPPLFAATAHTQIAELMLANGKVKEVIARGCDRLVDKVKARGLNAEGQEELRVALNKFMNGLVDEGVLTKPIADALGEQLTEEEAVTTLAFLRSSAGSKFLNGQLKLGIDRERMSQALQESMKSRMGELTAIMTRIAGKHNVRLQ